MHCMLRYRYVASALSLTYITAHVVTALRYLRNAYPNGDHLNHVDL